MHIDSTVPLFSSFDTQGHVLASALSHARGQKPLVSRWIVPIVLSSSAWKGFHGTSSFILPHFV